MTYKGSEINKQNLDPTLQQEISNATNKANNSWQMNKYNATSSMNLGDVSYSKSFQLHVSDWKSTSNTEILSIVFPTLVTFSGIIKLTASSNWNNTDAGGGVTVEYTTQLYSGTIHKYSKTIISVSPTFAKNYYLEDLVLDNTEKHLIIPIFKAPTANNSLYIEVSIVGINIPNDIMSKAHLVTSDAGSPTSLGYPWTPQTTSFMQKNQDNAISGSITSRNTFPFILKPDGMRAHMFHKDANGSLYIAPTDENGNAEWGLGTVFSLDGTVYMPKLMVDGVDLKQSVSNGKAQVASAITGKGVQTASDATFETMANNINAIQTIGGAKGNGTSYMSDSSTIFSVSGLSFGPRVINIYSSNGGARIIYNPMVSHIADTFAFDTNNYRWHNYGGTNVQLLPNGFIATATAPNLLGSYYWEAFK